MNLKYIDWTKDGFIRLRKSIDGKVYNFGSYKSLGEAMKMRDYFEREGWRECLSERLKYSTKPKYWTYTKTGKYIPQRRINGKIVYGCICNSLDECLAEVELLNECGWDLDALCEGIDETVEGGIKFLDGVKKGGSTFQTPSKGRNDYFAMSRGKHSIY